MPSDLKPSEKEEREVERLINRKPAPSRKNRSKRGPKHETRRRRMKVDDPDVGKADKDLSLNYKYASSLFIIASRMVLADDLSGPVESLEEEIQVLRTSIGGASKSILADFDSWCENNIDPSINSIDRIERMKERQGGKLNKEISSQLKSLTSTVQKKISSLQRAFDTTSKIRLSGLDQKRILDIVSDIWSRQGASFGSKAGVLSALKSAIDSSGFPKSISIALSRDPSDKAAKSKVLQEIVKDFGSSFNEEELKKSDFIALAAMSAIYRIMSKNPDSFNERAVKKSVDDMTSRIYNQVQELATIGTFMDAWSEAAEKHFGENPKDYGYKLADPSALHKAMEGFFSRPSSSDDLFDAVDVGKAMVKASKDRFGKVPEFLSKFASISSESQSSYETVQTEMLKTASYHGVQKQGHPSGSGPHWSSPDKRYIGKSHHDSIIASAKEFLSKDGWFKDWNGGAKDAPIRAALDLAIHTADESAYQSKIDASTYEMLLNRLGSYNYNLFSDTLIPGSKRSSSTMKKDAISNILRIASEIRKKDPKMALSLAQSVRSLASEQAQQAQQQQGQQQEQAQQQQGQQQEQAQQEQQGGSAFMPNEKKIEDMDESAKKKLVDELSKGVDELLKADDISDFLTGLKEVENVTKKVGSFRPRIAAGLVDLQKLLSEMEDMPEQDQKALMQMWKEGEKPLSDAKKELEKAGEGFTAEDLEAFAAGLDEALGGLEEEVKKAHTGSVRISLATLVRLAHSTPSTRSVLLPIIAAKKDKKDKKKGKKVSQKKEEAPSKEKAPTKGKAPSKEKAPVKGKAPKGKVKKASIQIDISDANWLSVTTFIYFNTRR